MLPSRPGTRHGGGMRATLGEPRPRAWAECPNHPSGQGSLSAPQGVILCFTRAPGCLMKTMNHSLEGFWFLKETRDPPWAHVEAALFFI